MAKFLPGSSAGFYDSQQSDYDYAIDFLLDEGYAQSVEEADALIEQLIHEEIYLVLEHLINEGYANSENSAINIMSCMSDAWLNNIIEEFVPLTPKKEAKVLDKINSLTKEAQRIVPRFLELKKAPKGNIGREDVIERMSKRLNINRRLTRNATNAVSRTHDLKSARNMISRFQREPDGAREIRKYRSSGNSIRPFHRNR